LVVPSALCDLFHSAVVHSSLVFSSILVFLRWQPSGVHYFLRLQMRSGAGVSACSHASQVQTCLIQQYVNRDKNVWVKPESN